MKKAVIQLLLCGLGTEVAEVAGSRFADPAKIVRGFVVVGSRDFADSRSFAAVVVAEGAVVEYILEMLVVYILEMLVVKMDCTSWTKRLAVRSALHTTFAGFGAERVVGAAGELE